jgi:signal transduction histidine kinase
MPIVKEDSVLGYLVVGSPTDLIDQQHRLAVSLALGSLGMLVVAFLGGLWLADRAMRPVAAIASAARSITESDLGKRLNMHGRDELADLAATFDGMISRLQAAFDRQKRFVADASHELRTPLTIINLEVGRALVGRRQVHEYKHALEVVRAESERMTRLANDLMTLARMDSGQAVLQMEPLDLSDIAREAVTRLSPLALRRKVRLESHHLEPTPVAGDRQYLLQMISNLLENGVKYSGSGQRVRIEISCQVSSASLRVTDTGPGIPPERLSAVFDRFYRVDQSRSQTDADPSSPSGSGLGLSIVASIVHAHGGKIRVDSQLNEGTTFEVILPLRQTGTRPA